MICQCGAKTRVVATRKVLPHRINRSRKCKECNRGFVTIETICKKSEKKNRVKELLSDG